jgi:L-lactate dehydrogenase complex protein LldG
MSRERILQRIRRNRPPTVALPDVPAFAPPPGARRARFVAAVEAAAGAVVLLDGDVGAWVQRTCPDARGVAARLDETVPGAWRPEPDTPPRALADLDLFLCEGTLGVAENGAVWVGEAAAGRRAALFLPEHVVLVLPRSALVDTMHEAYRRLDVRAAGFGVFIAGPSKTADIAQALVIGAHGPRRLTVLLR